MSPPCSLPPRRRGKAGVQNVLKILDSRFRGNDKIDPFSTFYGHVKVGSNVIIKATVLFANTLHPKVTKQHPIGSTAPHSLTPETHQRKGGQPYIADPLTSYGSPTES
ncbi:MAG: hypothetical protein JW950_07125 [Deltaproteobacteria bacterium]|nr:hypothetical protein [Deltaproteobacteria bacterium]